MVGIIIVMHGKLGNELLKAAKRHLGEQACERIEVIEVGKDDDRDEKTIPDIKDAIKRVDQGKGVVIVADMFGGTPCNAAVTAMEEKIYDGTGDVIAGANLPLLLKLIADRSVNLANVVDDAEAEGRKDIGRASEGPAAMLTKCFSCKRIDAQDAKPDRHDLLRPASRELLAAK